MQAPDHVVLLGGSVLIYGLDRCGTAAAARRLGAAATTAARLADKRAFVFHWSDAVGDGDHILGGPVVIEGRS